MSPLARPLIRTGEPHPPTPFVMALGANLGDRESTLSAAVDELAAVPGVRVVAVSSWFETVAVGPAGDDPDAPRYLNGVALGESAIPARDLLTHLHRIEAEHGRTREVRWGDRTLDLDLIRFGDEVSDDPHLLLPHPRAHERAFVLEPWLSVDRAASLPGKGAVADLLAALAPGATRTAGT